MLLSSRNISSHIPTVLDAHGPQITGRHVQITQVRDDGHLRRLGDRRQLSPLSHCCSHSSPPVSTCLYPSFREKPRSFQRNARMSQAMHHYVLPKPSVFPAALLASLCWYVSHPTESLPLQHCDNRVNVTRTYFPQVVIWLIYLPSSPNSDVLFSVSTLT